MRGPRTWRAFHREKVSQLDEGDLSKKSRKVAEENRTRLRTETNGPFATPQLVVSWSDRIWPSSRLVVVAVARNSGNWHRFSAYDRFAIFLLRSLLATTRLARSMSATALPPPRSHVASSVAPSPADTQTFSASYCPSASLLVTQIAENG